jgi:hypothetical protein
MDATTLAAFRQGVYATFSRARDALFAVADALLTAAQPRSFVELSQAPGMQRRWPRCYAALADGRIDRAALRRHFARSLPPPAPGARLALALDTSPIHRPEAATVADRTLVYAPNTPPGATPVLPGWTCSTLVALPDPVRSWTYVLDNRRVPSTESATTVGAEQLAALLPLLPTRPVLVADGHDGTAAWVAATSALPCDQLLRAKRTAVLHRPAPPRTGKRGRPTLDGPRFQGSDPATHGPPDAQWQGTDARGQAVSVACWGNLHLKACRGVSVTAIRIVRAGAADTKRDPREAWFWWVGEALPPRAALPPLSARRFGIEHGYKLDKQALLWDAPRVRTPEQFERWTDLVAAAHTQLVLARPLAEIARRPWDARRRAASPQQVRRAMGRIIAQVGTPARPPRPRGKSPGRPFGAVVKRATRHPVLRKAPPKAA